MASPTDTYTDLNPGTGGSRMDEAAPKRQDGETRHRVRLVISGDGQEEAVVDLVNVGGEFHLPTYDTRALAVLADIAYSLNRINVKLAKMSNTIP